MGGQLSARPYSTSSTKIPMRHAVARINAAVIFNRAAARYVATPPRHPPTCALPSSYLRRCTLGF